jgi:hypothetical protein
LVVWRSPRMIGRLRCKEIDFVLPLSRVCGYHNRAASVGFVSTVRATQSRGLLLNEHFRWSINNERTIRTSQRVGGLQLDLETGSGVAKSSLPSAPGSARMSN